MNNSIIQRLGLRQIAARCLIPTVLGVSALASGVVFAAGEVREIQTTEQPATPYRYSVDGQTYDWGMGQNQIMQSFSTDSAQFTYASSADRVELRRRDLAGVSTGNPCGVFVERLGAASEVVKADYPSDGSGTGNCDMAAMLTSRVVNRGALDLFSNSGKNPKNVERVDYIYDRGVLSAISEQALSKSGHVVAEKRGNNPLQVAVITGLDVLGQPSSFGPLVFVDRNNCSDPTICYGVTNIRHNYSFFQNDSEGPQGFPGLLRTSTESVGMAFVSHADLGLSNGQIYYGFSYFPADVDESVHTLTDINTFPEDTNDEKVLFGDGPDIYGGVSGYFLADSLSVASGAVFNDENGDAIKNDSEAGISDVGLTLYKDSNNNGVFDAGIDAQVGPGFTTNVDGEFHVPGLEDGVYFLLLDESDADLPPGLVVAPGGNPVMISINGNDASNIVFGFVSESGASDAGASDAGASDAGASDAGASDAGASDAGASDAGASDAGASDAGASDAGASDAGSSDAGASDAGSSDAGASDAGASDAGASDAGASDAGASDAGGSDGDFIIIDDGVNATVANPDTVTVNHGSSAIIDVLSNDTDAAGTGLTLVSVSESANADIVIEDGKVVYTPEYGFYGADSFLYVMEDSAGTQDTGTVSVDVVRYSDINNNLLNDFDECDCDDLSIEVGVDGSVLGSSSFLALAALWMLFGLRRATLLRRTSPAGDAL